MPKNEPSTRAKGATKDFWKKHSVSPDTTKIKRDSSEAAFARKFYEHKTGDPVTDFQKRGLADRERGREKRAHEELEKERDKARMRKTRPDNTRVKKK